MKEHDETKALDAKDKKKEEKIRGTLRTFYKMEEKKHDEEVDAKAAKKEQQFLKAEKKNLTILKARMHKYEKEVPKEEQKTTKGKKNTEATVENMEQWTPGRTDPNTEKRLEVDEERLDIMEKWMESKGHHREQEHGHMDRSRASFLRASEKRLNQLKRVVKSD